MHREILSLRLHLPSLATGYNVSCILSVFKECRQFITIRICIQDTLSLVLFGPIDSPKHGVKVHTTYFLVNSCDKHDWFIYKGQEYEIK